jgi:hypothetical protein
MSSSPLRERHLDVRTVLDYLDQKLDASGRRAADAHLGRPCAACRERVREVGALLEAMRSDRAGEVPAWLHARALDVFAGREQASAARRFVEVLAELVFDSLVSPLPAAVRRSVGEARRLRFQLGPDALDVELEPEGGATQLLRGRLEADDAALWTLEVTAGGECVTIRPGANGDVLATDLPAGPLHLRVEGPAGTFRLPPIEP